MNHYTYTDNNKHEIIFECDADDILHADAQFKIATNLDIHKLSHVGCSIPGGSHEKE
jgi:hypothetical protein